MSFFSDQLQINKSKYVANSNVTFVSILDLRLIPKGHQNIISHELAFSILWSVVEYPSYDTRHEELG